MIMKKGDFKKLYQRYTLPFSDITTFIKEHYNEGSYFIPLGSNIDCILDGSDDEFIPDEMMDNYQGDFNFIDRKYIGKERDIKEHELYASIYDYRLVRSYIRYGESLQEVNIKRFGPDSGNGALTSIKFVLDGSDNFNIPFSGKICKKLQEKYDKYVGNRNMLVWVPVWNVRNKEATVINLFGRIDIVFT